MTHKFNGNILFFYLFDIGDQVNLEVIKSQGLLTLSEGYLSPFKYYQAPLSFEPRGPDSFFNKIYEFGVLSLCYKVPFSESLDQLKAEISALRAQYDQKSLEDAGQVYQSILPAIHKPSLYNLKWSYIVIQVNPVSEYNNPEDFKKQFGPKIASLLRLETHGLSDYQKDEILSSVTGYYGEDLIIIDSSASFIYDNEYHEALELIEAANLERLELQYFDRVLEKELRNQYTLEKHKIPLLSYVPVLGRMFELPVSQLTRMRIDIAVITERLKNSIKLSGDAYYARLYSMLVKKLLLKEWRESIDKKLDIFKDLYTVYQDRLDSTHDRILTWVIIILIAAEVVLFMK